MIPSFLHVQGREFAVNGERIILRGFGFGNWLNLEHFMIGLPGSESQLRASMESVYGTEETRHFWEQYRSCYILEEDFQFLKSLGVNAVRIPFNYHLFESDQLPYKYDLSGFSHLDRVVGLCEKYQIYGILDLHAAPGSQNPDWHSDNALGESLFWDYADFRRRVIVLWRIIATHYRDNPWVGAYDLLNEPVVSRVNRNILPGFFSELIHEIRLIDPNHLIFVEGDHYAQDFRSFETLADPNAACSFHFYPFLYRELLTITENRPELMEKTLFQTVTFEDLDRLGRPIWCGETGALFNDTNRPLQEELLGEMLAILEKRGISWSLWSYKDARSMSVVHPTANSRWMEFTKKFQWAWEYWTDNAAAEKIIAELTARFSGNASEEIRRKLLFRVQADFQLLSSECCRKTLEGIPFEELITNPESFRFKNCEIWSALVDLVTRYTRVS